MSARTTADTLWISGGALFEIVMVSVEALLISGGVLIMMVMGLVAVFNIPPEAPEMERDDDATRDQPGSGSDEPAGKRPCE